MNLGAVRITVLADECIRIEYAPGADGRFVDAPSLFAIHGPSGRRAVDDGEWQVITTPIDPRTAGHPERFGVPLVVKTKRMTLTFTPDGEAPNPRNLHALIEHPSPPKGVEVRDGKVVWTPGARNRFNLGGTLSTLDGLRGPAPLHEGLLARDGWHLVDDSKRHLLVDGWAMSREQYGAHGNIDWYLFGYGVDYRAAFRALANIAGEVPLPRKYALGSWFSRYWPYTSTEFRGIVEEYHAHGFPLDVMVLDMDWHKDGWTGWSWNRELLPDAEELVEWMHGQNLAVTLNLHPADGVGPHEDRYAPFMRAIGREPDGSRAAFDAADRRYMEALFREVHTPLEPGAPGAQSMGAGVDFWWLDWQQDRYTRSMPGLSNLRWLNHLYMQHTTRPIGTLGADDPGLRPLSFSRWAADSEANDPGWGDHRHPVQFSGDAHTGWPMLAFQVHFTLTAGNVGCFYWSHDIGGHFGPRFEEATTRWMQFGALSPVLRLHSARSETLDRRPWTYEEKFCDAMRSAFRLRAELMPTIYSAAAEAHRETVPLIRPMYVGYPMNDRAYQTPGQYTIGRDVLCAPIVLPGLGEKCVSTQAVWFPPVPVSKTDVEGVAPLVGGWHDLESGERFECEGEAIVADAIDETPVFIRSGVPLATRTYTERMGTERLDELVVRLFPGAPGQTERSDVYEDDGVSLDYTRGGSAQTPMLAAWNSDERGLELELTIGPTTGSFRGQSNERALTIRLHGVSSASVESATNSFDKPLQSTFDAGECGGTLSVQFYKHSIRQAVTVRMRLEPIEHADRSVERRARLLGAAMGLEIRPTEMKAKLAQVLAESKRSSREREQLLAIGAGIGLTLIEDELRLIDTYAWLDPTHVQSRTIDRVSTHETQIDARALTLTGGGTIRSRAATVPLPGGDHPMPIPAIGERVVRLVRIDAKLQDKAISFEHEVSSRLAPVQAFRVVGPFDWDWRSSIIDAKYPPESEALALNASASFSGKNGETIGWTPAKAGDKWDVDFRASFPGRGGLGYALTSLRSPHKQHARLFVESSDKIEMFVNGVKIYSLDAFDSHAAALGYADVSLSAGDNQLLVKASEGGGGWGFTLGIEANAPISVSAEAMP